MREEPVEEDLFPIERDEEDGDTPHDDVLELVLTEPGRVGWCFMALEYAMSFFVIATPTREGKLEHVGASRFAGVPDLGGAQITSRGDCVWR